MDRNLMASALTKFLCGLLVTGALLFLPAGSLRYGRGWLLMGVLFVPMLGMGLWLLLRHPELLRRRLRTGEREPTQRRVVLLSALMFLLGFAAAGLSWRFSLLMLPLWVSIAAAELFLLCYLLYGEVLRENEYLSRTVEVQEGQTVIDTGLYGVVRHPMYAATVGMFLTLPLVLGSVLSLLVFLVYPVLIVRRIRNEEAVLAQELEGYRDYMKKVRYRLLPPIW